ncbi:MAG: glycosyltransferase family 2 protein [Methanothrix sp.]|nr:glycosyltransferase family 2 protein [Methanothrix sp.]
MAISPYNPKNPIVSIIILNWNGWKDTVECLESLYQITYDNYNLILIDNGSENSSLEEIRDYLSGKKPIASKYFEYSSDNKPVKILEYTNSDVASDGGREDVIVGLPSRKRIVIIKNDKNYGFAEGNNIGIRYALKFQNPDYILLLNNDTVVKSDFLDKLVNAMDREERIGFAGPIIYYYDRNGRTDLISVAGVNHIMRKGSYRRIGTGEVDRGQYHSIVKVDSLEGSCLLVRRTVFEKIGLLDTSYFLYWEETDLCRRGFEAGFGCIIVPTTGIWHKVSTSKPRAAVTYYKTRNRLWFVKSHASKEELVSFLCYFCLFQFWATIAGYLYRQEYGNISSFLRGVLHGATRKKQPKPIARPASG